MRKISRKGCLQSGVMTAVMASILSPASADAEILISENLSLSGFVDMSAGSTDSDDPDVGTSEWYGLDQFELDFMYEYDVLCLLPSHHTIWMFVLHHKALRRSPQFDVRL